MNIPVDIHTVDMEPIGRRLLIEAGKSVLEAAQAAGVGMISLCGGEGWRQSCLIRVAEGKISPPSSAEREHLSEEEIAEGYRLACQTIPQSDVKIYIPPQSLSTPQRLQIEGQETKVELDPIVAAVDIAFEPPSLNDLRADATRVK